jgi:hypothetical protein
VAEREKWWQHMPIKRHHTYRRLALEHGGGAGKVNECVVVRAHDRSLPMKLRMFYTVNRAQKNFSAEDGKELAQDWDSPKVGLVICDTDGGGEREGDFTGCWFGMDRSSLAKLLWCTDYLRCTDNM